MPLANNSPPSRRTAPAKRNVRWYPPPEGHPGDPLLNVNAVWFEFGVHPATFSIRQQRRCWPGLRGKKLTAKQMHYVLPGDPPDAWRPEDTYLYSEVKKAVEQPKRTRGVRELADGTRGLNQRAVAKKIGVTTFTIRRMEERGELTATPGHSPENGLAEKHYSEDEAETRKAARKAGPPDRITIGLADPEGRPPGVYARSDLASRRLAEARVKQAGGSWEDLAEDQAARAVGSARVSLCSWEKGCPKLRGTRLGTIEIPHAKGPRLTYYREDQIQGVVEAVLSPMPAAPGYLTLTEATAQTKANEGPQLSRVFLFRQIEKCEFLPEGKLSAMTRTPPSVSGKGKPQWEILPADLVRLQEAIRLAQEEATRPLPAGYGTWKEVGAHCNTPDVPALIRLNRQLREWINSGRLPKRRIWRAWSALHGVAALHRVTVYDLEAARKLWAEENKTTPPIGTTLSATGPYPGHTRKPQQRGPKPDPIRETVLQYCYDEYIVEERPQGEVLRASRHQFGDRYAPKNSNEVRVFARVWSGRWIPPLPLSRGD
jgi:hypothetical protein